MTTVTPRDVPVVHEGVATLEGFITANINAQVQGYIISRDYKEGSLVKKGDLLFQIDPRPFEATLDQAKGNLAVAQSNQTKADVDELRKIAGEIKELSRRVPVVQAILNNNYQDHGQRNARTFSTVS